MNRFQHLFRSARFSVVAAVVALSMGVGTASAPILSARVVIPATVLVLSMGASSASAQCLTPCPGGTPTPILAIEQPKPPSVPAFTLIELLVVIAIIAILIA